MIAETSLVQERYYMYYVVELTELIFGDIKPSMSKKKITIFETPASTFLQRTKTRTTNQALASAKNEL